MASTVALRGYSSAATSAAQLAHNSRTKTNRVDRFITNEPFGLIVGCANCREKRAHHNMPESILRLSVLATIPNFTRFRFPYSSLQLHLQSTRHHFRRSVPAVRIDHRGVSGGGYLSS